MNRIVGGELVVHAIEEVFFIALVVHHHEFRRIEEAAAVQTVGGNEIPPVLASIGKSAATLDDPNDP